MLFPSFRLAKTRKKCKAGNAYGTSYSREQVIYEKKGYYAKVRVGFIFLA